MSSATQSLPPEAISALESGNKVEAIKCIRADNNLSMKEAKDYIEAYLNQAPAVNDESTESKARKLSDMEQLIIAVVVVGIYYFIAGRL